MNPNWLKIEKDGNEVVLKECSEESEGEIVIPEGVTEIHLMAFMSCRSLTSITIPASVTKIGDCAFECCSSLASINIPNSVTKIGDFAFSCCISLASINIPASVRELGRSVFSGCKVLASIVVDQGNGKYDSRDNSNAIIDTATNKLVAGCMNTLIPDSVTKIGDVAFRGCSTLTSITIPATVTEIGHGAFFGSGLTSINIPDSVTSIGFDAFGNCKALVTAVIPDSVTKIGTNAFSICSELKTIIYKGTTYTKADEAIAAINSNKSLESQIASFVKKGAVLDCLYKNRIDIDDAVAKLVFVSEKAEWDIDKILSDTINLIEENVFRNLFRGFLISIKYNVGFSRTDGYNSQKAQVTYAWDDCVLIYKPQSKSTVVLSPTGKIKVPEGNVYVFENRSVRGFTARWGRFWGMYTNNGDVLVPCVCDYIDNKDYITEFGYKGVKYSLGILGSLQEPKDSLSRLLNDDKVFVCGELVYILMCMGVCRDRHCGPVTIITESEDETNNSMSQSDKESVTKELLNIMISTHRKLTEEDLISKK